MALLCLMLDMVYGTTIWYPVVPDGTTFQLKTNKWHNSTQNCLFSMIPKPEWSEFRCDSFPEMKRIKFPLSMMTFDVFDMFDRIAVPSEFCKRVFSRQFPNKEFYIIHAHIPSEPYVFYHIGNILCDSPNLHYFHRKKLT